MDVSDIIGQFGPFQYRLLAVICLRAISAAFLLLTFQLISFDVGFYCHHPENTTDPEFNSFGLPRNVCFTEPEFNKTVQDDLCQNCQGFRYENCTVHESLVQEWDLVCSREKYISFGYLAFTLGNFLSYIPAGHLADRYGRRPLSIMGQLLIILTTLTSSLSNSVEMYLVTRVLTGIAFGLTQNPLLCLFLESVGPRYRDLLVLSFAGAWGLGMMAAASVAYVVPQWRILYHLTNFLLHTPLLLVLWFVPESVRWLLTVGRNKKAEYLMVKQAAANGITVVDSQSLLDMVKKKIAMDDSSGPSIWELCQNRQLRKTTVVIYLGFAMTVFTYHGFMMTIGHLGGSLHANVFLTGMVELPVVVLYFVIVKFFDRRRGLLFCYFLSGSLFLLTLTLSNDMPIYRISLAMVGRLLNALAYAILYVYAAELFPTSLRAVAVSGAMAAGRVGGMISPLADILARIYGQSAPIAIYGVLSIITSFILLILPETRNKPLPDTVEESEKLAGNLHDVTDDEMKALPLKEP